MWPPIVYKGVWGSEDDMSGRRVELQVTFSVIPAFFIHLCSKAKRIWRILPPISGDIGDSLLNDNVGLPTPGETSIEDRHVTCQVKFKSSGLWGPQAVRWMSKCGLLLSPTHGQGWYTYVYMTGYDWSPNQRLLALVEGNVDHGDGTLW